MASGGLENEYRIVFAQSARRELENLPRTLGSRVLRRIEALARAARAGSCGPRQLAGKKGFLRPRVARFLAADVGKDDDRDRVVVTHKEGVQLFVPFLADTVFPTASGAGQPPRWLLKLLSVRTIR